MRRTRLFITLAVISAAAAAPLFADLTAIVDLLDPSDGGPQPPANVLVVDFLIDVDAGDAWLASGIAASAVAGNTILFGDADPNSPLLNPGADNPFVTSISVPLPRFGPARFDAGRAVILGSDCPLLGHPVIESGHVSASWYDQHLAPCVDRPTESGAIARIAVAVDPALACIGNVGCCYAVYPPDAVPIGAIPVLEGDCSENSPAQRPPFGIAWGTCDHPDITYRAWILAQTPVAGSCRFDLNRDGTINLEDLAIVLAAFGALEGQPGFDPQVDFDDNARIDLQDLATFLAHYGAF